jgi:type II secretory pathway pseudopilin PulG
VRRARPKSGFTLIETIFSTLFIGVTILAIVNLFPGAYLSIRKSEMQLQADIVAKSVLDELRLISFDQLMKDSGSPEVIDGKTCYKYQQVGAPFSAWTVEGIRYAPEVLIYEVPGAQFDFLKGVRVTVRYVNLNEHNRESIYTKELVHETYLHKLIR